MPGIDHKGAHNGGVKKVAYSALNLAFHVQKCVNVRKIDVNLTLFTHIPR